MERCIGCGVCGYPCPTVAMTLESRSDFVQPSKSFRDLISLPAAAKAQA